MTRDEILKLEAGPKMNQLIWWKVFDMTPTPKDNDMLKLPPYSTDIAAAWEVVEHFTGKDCRNQDFFIECWSDGEWFVAFHPLGYSSRDPKANCDGKTTGSPSAPLAICRAALLAVIEQ
jgi:hypothetical protein